MVMMVMVIMMVMVRVGVVISWTLVCIIAPHDGVSLQPTIPNNTQLNYATSFSHQQYPHNTTIPPQYTPTNKQYQTLPSQYQIISHFYWVGAEAQKPRDVFPETSLGMD